MTTTYDATAGNQVANLSSNNIFAGGYQPSQTFRGNNTIANISPTDLKRTETTMISNVIMQMQSGESPLDRGMLPRAYGDDDNDSTNDNYRF